MQLATIYISRMRLGVPVNYKDMLIFYVDKRERMIVFRDVVAVLSGVVAEANPGYNATPYHLRFYGNEYQYRSVLVRREACDADPALLGTKATFTRRATSGRGRPLAV